jgi:hypothetical protein
MSWSMGGLRGLRRGLAVVVIACMSGCGGDGDSLLAGVDSAPRPTRFIQVTPAELLFSEPLEERSVSVSNAGSAVIEVGAVSLSPSDSGFSIAADDCSDRSLEPSQTCSVTVRLDSEPAAAKAAALSIPSNDPQRPTVSVDVAVVQGEAFRVTPLSVDFGDVAVGETAGPSIVTVTNAQATPLVIQVGPLEGASAADFEMDPTDCTEAPVPAGGSCGISATFTPTSAEAKQATFAILAGSERVVVRLSGAGLGPVPVVAPLTRDFGGVTLGASKVLTFRLSNEGTQDAEFGSITIAGSGFSLPSADRCGNRRFAPGESCLLEVAFAPTVLGAHFGTVFLPVSNSASPELAVSVEGTGVASVAVTPANFVFASPGQPATQSFQFENASARPVRVSSISLSGPASADFSLPPEQDRCSNQTVAAGASCAFVVRFAPSEAGSRLATIRVASDDPLFPLVEAQVSGAGALPTPAAEIFPESFAFGNQGIGLDSAVATFEIRSTGRADLVLGGGTILQVFPVPPYATPFAIRQDGCSFQILPPGARCTVGVVFAPRDLWVQEATLAFPSNDPSLPGANGPVTASLSGFGIPPLVVTPGTVGFGPVAVGAASPAEAVVRLSNFGPTPSPVGAVAVDGPGFAIAGDTCSLRELPPAAGGVPTDGCSIVVHFAPTGLGPHVGTLTVPSASRDMEVSLSGVGTP